LVIGTVLETDPRSCDKVSNGARDEHLTCDRQCGDACCNVHGHTCYILTSKLNLARMETSTKVYANTSDVCGNGPGALDSSRGPIEGGQGAVSGGINQPTPETLELALNRVVVAVE
jgi:hypothetical protein